MTLGLAKHEKVVRLGRISNVLGLWEHMKIELLFNRMKCGAIRCISKRQNTF